MINKNVSNNLSPEEKVIWEDHPVFSVFILKTALPLIILGTPFFLLFGLIFFATVKSGAIIAVPILIPTFFMLLTIIILPIYLILKKKYFPTYYITSNKRVFVTSDVGGFSSPFSPLFAVFSINNVTDIVVTQGIFERIFGKDIKTISFKIGLSDQLPIIQTAESKKVSIGNVTAFIPTQNTEISTAAYLYGKRLSFDSIHNANEVITLFE